MLFPLSAAIMNLDDLGGNHYVNVAYFIGKPIQSTEFVAVLQ